MTTEKKYSHIIWDWNGTLLDDISWCIEVMNTLLRKRDLKPLNGVSDYHKIFTFPLINYYINAGFDFQKEPFGDVATEYISLYNSQNSGGSRLHKNAERVLKSINEMGIEQIILSASEQNNLLLQLSWFDIQNYFDETIGISDIYARSKIEAGLDYMARKKIRNGLIIGDTTHDYDVSVAMGMDCILIPNGHQSREALMSCNVPILDDISCVSESLSRNRL